MGAGASSGNAVDTLEDIGDCLRPTTEGANRSRTNRAGACADVSLPGFG